MMVDALSRCDEEAVVVHALSIPNFDLYDQFCSEAAALQEIITMRQEIKSGIARTEWSMCRRSSPCAKTLHRLCATFFTPGDNKLVRDFIKSCSACQRNKIEHLHPTRFLQPLTVPSTVWSDITMDFIEGFPKVGGKSVILTIVDYFSKFAHFIPLGHPYSAASEGKAFFDNIVRLHDVPASIVSDRDSVFTSNLWHEMFHLADTRHCTRSAFHPQTDSQSEVTNKIVTVYLRCLNGYRPRSWLWWLPWAEYCYNTSFQSALKATPFEVVYGCPPLPMLPFQPGSTRVAIVDCQLRDRDTFIAEIKERLLQAQALMK
jgi:hypothetical protein